MIKHYLLISILSMGLVACKKDKVAVIPDKIKALIAAQKDCSCEPYINQYAWKNKATYAYLYKGQACDWTPQYFDQDGNPITMEDGYSLDTFLAESILKENVWTCK